LLKNAKLGKRSVKKRLRRRLKRRLSVRLDRQLIGRPRRRLN
jgi:hypothetical protein